VVNLKNAKPRAHPGLTLLELLVSLLILSLVLTGLGNVFVVARSFMMHTRARTAAGQAGKFVLSPLQGAVSADTYDMAGLKPGVSTGETVTVDGINFNSSLNISNVTSLPAGGLLRKVDVNISWHEMDL
jgi:prepilin-type N-terminal cleavage/methylation domain-containing protein